MHGLLNYTVWEEGESESATRAQIGEATVEKGGIQDSKLGRGMEGTSQSKETDTLFPKKREITGRQKEPSKRAEKLMSFLSGGWEA